MKGHKVFLEDGGTSAHFNVGLFEGCQQKFSGGSAGCAMGEDVVDHMYSLLCVMMKKSKAEETSGGVPEEKEKGTHCSKVWYERPV